MTLKSRIFLPFMVGLLLMLATHLAGLYIFEKQETALHVETVQRLADDMLSSDLEKRAAALHGMLFLLAQRDDLMEIWARGDRERLREMAAPLFEELRQQSGVAHFYFHDADRRVFLRMHKPDQWGDLIDRHSLVEAARTDQPFHGIEFGPIGGFMLRAVHPVQWGGQRLGFLELGVPGEVLVKELAETLGAEILLAVDTAHVPGLASGDTGGQRIILSTLPRLPAFVTDRLAEQGITGDLPVDQKIDQALAPDFNLATAPLYDHDKHPIGSVTALFDRSPERNLGIRVLGGSLLASVAVLILLGLFYFRHVSRVEHDIESTSRDLNEYHRMLDTYVISSTTDLDGKITWVSKAFCDVTGFAEPELLGMNHNIVRHPDTPAALFQEMWQTLRSGEDWTGEILNRTKNGTDLWLKSHISPMKNARGDLVGYKSVRQNISERKLVETMALTDQLTGLYNRRHFDNQLELFIRTARRHRTPLILAMLDVDHFKLFNDRFGHQEGDRALRTVADILRTNLRRPDDQVFRTGGEEFCIILANMTVKSAREQLEHIRIAVHAARIAHPDNPADGRLTVSIGFVAECPDSTMAAPERLYREADRALYRAKALGRNRLEGPDKDCAPVTPV
ncbi:hypothetical protein JCM17960_08820 [Magnetospira thiophila]